MEGTFHGAGTDRTPGEQFGVELGCDQVEDFGSGRNPQPSAFQKELAGEPQTTSDVPTSIKIGIVDQSFPSQPRPWFLEVDPHDEQQLVLRGRSQAPEAGGVLESRGRIMNGTGPHNDQVERLAAEVARLTGESKTEAIRRALEERRNRLKATSTTKDTRRTRVLRFLEKSVWNRLPKSQKGRRLSRADEDEILGYGPGGV